MNQRTSRKDKKESNDINRRFNRLKKRQLMVEVEKEMEGDKNKDRGLL